MANMAGLKKRLPAPPGPEDASQNITAPEVAPADPEHLQTQIGPSIPVIQASTSVVAQPATPEPRLRRDMRSARRTNRTLPFSTKVSPEFDERVREIAFRDKLMLCELLERALDAYERERIVAG